MSNINTLPTEILSKFCLLAVDAQNPDSCSRSLLCAIARSSKRLNDVVTPILYRELQIHTESDDEVPLELDTLYHNPTQLLSYIETVYVDFSDFQEELPPRIFWTRITPEPKSTLCSVDLPRAWGVPLKISNIMWKVPQKSERLNSWWLTRLIILNASTLKSLRMKVTPNNRESDVDLRKSEKPPIANADIAINSIANR
ncbi:hypothetical protein TWF970_004208 [Orbilia oligospora]|uniref:F-box domain-containing protein n=1 Tax=Orbilia oligospora TaxID=2813651 RepID=A0A7C8VEW0_ORBOL|nr:hypothetical protein TWF970_004208 [Orbilia oligospora]